MNRNIMNLTCEPISRENNYPFCNCSVQTIYLIKAIIWKSFWFWNSHDEIIYSCPKYEFEAFLDNLYIVCFHMFLISNWMRWSNQGVFNRKLVIGLIWARSITKRIVPLDDNFSIRFDHSDIVSHTWDL